MKTVSTGVKEPGVRTFSKKELIDQVAVRTGLSRSDVKVAVIDFVNLMREQLGAGHRIEFRNFGVFEIKRRKRRSAQNPKTLERVEVPPRRTVKFKVGAELKQKLAALDRAEARGLLQGGEPVPPPDVRIVATDPPKSPSKRASRSKGMSNAKPAATEHNGHAGV